MDDILADAVPRAADPVGAQDLRTDGENHYAERMRLEAQCHL